MFRNRQGAILYFWIFILSCSFVFKDFGIWFLKNLEPKKPVTEREIFRGDWERELSGPPAVWSLESQLFQGLRETLTPLPWIGAPHGFQNGSQVNLSLKLREKKSGFNVILLPGLINIQWIEMLYYYYIYLIKYKTINIAILSIKSTSNPLKVFYLLQCAILMDVLLKATVMEFLTGHNDVLYNALKGQWT